MKRVRVKLLAAKRRLIARIPRVLKRHMETQGLSHKSRIVICHLFSDWYEHGTCAFNQGRVEYWAGSCVRRELTDFFRMMDKLGLTARTGKPKKNCRSIPRAFTIRGVETKNACFSCASSDALIPVLLCPEWRSVYLEQVDLKKQDEKWIDWCLAHDHELRLDSQGLTKWGKATHAGLVALRLPEDVSDIDTESLDDRKRAWLIRYMQGAGGVSPYVAIKRYRLYHALTNCPVLLREQAQFLHNGKWEPAVTVDLHACYWCVLVADLAPSAEKDELQELLKTRGFYATLAKEVGVAADGEFKKEVQKQCLFSPWNWPESKRAVWLAMKQRFPQLAASVEYMRSKLGVGGLSDWLMQSEARIMVHGSLIECSRFCPSLSIHDALLVPASESEKVKAVVARHAERVLGFCPAIKVG